MNFEPTLFVVDDDEAMRRSLRWLLETLRLPLQTFDSGEAFLEGYRGEPGVLILDVRMPGMSGLELLERLAETHPSLPAILLTAHGDVPMAVRALRAGAYDFVQKPYNGQALLERVQAAIGEARHRHQRQGERDSAVARLESLTPRECEVLELVAAGEPNKRIARELGISLRTVEVHRHNLMEKLDAHTVGDVIRLYLSATNGTI